MKQLPTAEQFLRFKSDISEDKTSVEYLTDCEVEEIMIEFAKMHVQAALTEASKTTKWKEQITMQGLQVTIIKSSILNAYPLTNIK